MSYRSVCCCQKVAPRNPYNLPESLTVVRVVKQGAHLVPCDSQVLKLDQNYEIDRRDLRWYDPAERYFGFCDGTLLYSPEANFKLDSSTLRRLLLTSDSGYISVMARRDWLDYYDEQFTLYLISEWKNEMRQFRQRLKDIFVPAPIAKVVRRMRGSESTDSQTCKPVTSVSSLTIDSEPKSISSSGFSSSLTLVE